MSNRTHLTEQDSVEQDALRGRLVAWIDTMGRGTRAELIREFVGSKASFDNFAKGRAYLSKANFADIQRAWDVVAGRVGEGYKEAERQAATYADTSELAMIARNLEDCAQYLRGSDPVERKLGILADTLDFVKKLAEKA